MMPITNISEAKAQLSSLIERALAGEEVLIGKAGRPVAKLVRYERSDNLVFVSAAVIWEIRIKQSLGGFARAFPASHPRTPPSRPAIGRRSSAFAIAVACPRNNRPTRRVALVVMIPPRSFHPVGSDSRWAPGSSLPKDLRGDLGGDVRRSLRGNFHARPDRSPRPPTESIEIDAAIEPELHPFLFQPRPLLFAASPRRQCDFTVLAQNPVPRKSFRPGACVENTNNLPGSTGTARELGHLPVAYDPASRDRPEDGFHARGEV
jgi:prevent-host-death family protein